MAGLLIVTARWGTYGVTARPAWGTTRWHTWGDSSADLFNEQG